MKAIDWLKMKMFNRDTGYSGNDKLLDRRQVKLEHVWLRLGSHVTSAIKFDIQPFLRQALTDENSSSPRQHATSQVTFAHKTFPTILSVWKIPQEWRDF